MEAGGGGERAHHSLSLPHSLGLPHLAIWPLFTAPQALRWWAVELHGQPGGTASAATPPPGRWVTRLAAASTQAA